MAGHGRGEPEISVIFPVFEEEGNLRQLVLELERAVEPMGRPYELIAVDDGSRDGSFELLKSIARDRPNLKLIRFRRNFGQSAALDAGFRSASGSIVVTLDSDLQNDPRDIPRMIAALESGFDVVSGWRKDRKDGMLVRRIPSLVANWLIRRVTRTRVNDLGCTLRVYRRAITDELRLYGELHRFLAVLAEGVGARVTELVVNHRPRVSGKSKYGLSRVAKVLLDLLTIWFMQGFRTKPIYLFGGIGIGMLGMGVASSAAVLYQKFALEVWVHRNPLLIVGVMFSVIGVQFLAMGLLAEVLMRTYFEARERPAYTVAEKVGFRGGEIVDIQGRTA